MQKYHKEMLSIAYQLTHDSTYAEEATQDAWISVAKNISTIRIDDEIKLKNYLHTITKRFAININKKSYKQNDIVEFDENISPIYEDAASTLLFNETKQIIATYYFSLNEKEQAVFKFRWLHDFTEKEISSLLNINYSTVRSIVFRIKKELGEILEKRGIK